jgi:hypothetical protein
MEAWTIGLFFIAIIFQLNCYFYFTQLLIAMILDEKMHVIIPLLDELRKYNHSIGSYEKSIMTESFDYSVKLSNGLIRLPEELVHDYENSPGTIILDRIKSAASNFIPSNSTIAAPSSTGALPGAKPIKGKRRTIILTASIAIVIILIIVIAVFLINRAHQLDEANARINQERIDSANTAQVNQKKLDSANTARINQKKLDSVNTAVEVAETAVRDRIRLYVTANCTYNYRLVGSITNLKITVANNTNYTMDSLKVRANYLKQAGGAYKSEELKFVGILPHTQTTLNAPDSDRGTHVQLVIETISSRQLGL